MAIEILSERFRWALQVLNPQPNEHLLEIGCGTGILAEQVASKLKSGHLVALDKSKPIIEKAIKRNEGFMKEGKANFEVADFSKWKGEAASFDKVFAFNVSPLWKQPQKTLSVLAAYLKPSGAFYLFYQPPYEITQHLAEEANKVLLENGFHVDKVLIEKLPGVSAFCIIAQPAKD